MIDLKGRFIIAGDWHGSAMEALDVISEAHVRDIPVIIHVGDFGIWRNDKPFLNKVESALDQYGIELYFIDGNHENFDMLYAKSFKEDGTRYVRNHISYLPRGHRWEWQGVSFMALGGAASIDRKFRKEGYDWWPHELLTEHDIAKAIEGGPVDVMFTHDSPSTAPNAITDNLSGQMNARRSFGTQALETCTWHRTQLARVTDAVVPKMLFHGHYHQFMQGTYTHKGEIHARGCYTGLDQGTGAFHKHTYIFDFEKARDDFFILDSYR